MLHTANLLQHLQTTAPKWDLAPKSLLNQLKRYHECARKEVMSLGTDSSAEAVYLSCQEALVHSRMVLAYRIQDNREIFLENVEDALGTAYSDMYVKTEVALKELEGEICRSQE